MTGCVVLTLLVLFAYFSASDANPSISTSTPTPCYGDVVTLVCHHPELASNPGRYLTTVPTWRENRVGITPSTGVYSATDTSEDLMNTTLNITITVDHFRNKSFNYSCFLVLAVPMGKLETSGVVTVDPVDQLPTPMNTAIFSNSTTAGLTVSFDPRCCNTAQLNVATTTSSSATTPVVLPVDSTDPTNTTIVITDVTESVCYTASIQSACRDNNLLEDSGVLVVNVNGPPEVTITTITDSTITLTWNTALRCFESEMFTFVVIWNEIGSGTSTNVSTSSSPYTISGLQPGTSYQISVQGVGGSGVVGGIRVLNVATTLAEPPTGGSDSTTAIAIAVVVLVGLVIFLVAVVIAIFRVVALCQKTRVRGVYDTGSRAHETIPPASSNTFRGGLSGTCAQADVESGNPPPIPPPPVEGVTYAEAVAVGEKEENGGGAASFQEPLSRRKGSKDGAQDIGESNLTEFKKFVSRTCKNLDKVSVLKRTIQEAGLVLIGTLILCGPASPESHLGMKTPDSHLGMKTYQPMWELDITCYQDGNKTEQVPLSQYVIAFSEQDIQNEANLEQILNPLLSMILQEGTMLCRLSAPRLQSTWPKLSVQ